MPSGLHDDRPQEIWVLNNPTTGTTKEFTWVSNLYNYFVGTPEVDY